MPRVKEVKQPETVSVEVVAEKPKTINVEHDPDRNLVYLTVAGRDLCLREPVAKDFMLAESWVKQAQHDYRDVDIVMVKLAALCSIDDGKAKKIGFDELFDSLVSFDDVEAVATAIGFFRDPISDWLQRIQKRALANS